MHWGWLAGLTITFAVSIGCVSASLSHTFGGKTRISAAVSNGSVKVGESTCVNREAVGTQNARMFGCDPNSTKVFEPYQSLNASPGDPLVISATRSEGRSRLSLGLGKTVSDPTGTVKFTTSVTKSYGAADALNIINSKPAKLIIPQKLNDKLQGYFAQPRLPPPFSKKTPFVPSWVPKTELSKTHTLREQLKDFQRLQNLKKRHAAL